jgi:hypothetical protein
MVKALEYKTIEFSYGPYGREECMPMQVSGGGLDLEVDVNGEAFTRDQVRLLLGDVVEMAVKRDRTHRRQDGWVRGDEWVGALLGVVEGVLRECCVPQDSAKEIEERVRGYLRARSAGYFAI